MNKIEFNIFNKLMVSNQKCLIKSNRQLLTKSHVELSVTTDIIINNSCINNQHC